MKKNLFILVLVLLVNVTFAQVDSILVKQERLIKNEKQLQQGLDSLQGLLSVTRGQYGSDNSDQVASEIIRLENQIYDVRSMLSRVGAQLAQNEALLAKNNYNEGQSEVVSTVNDNPDLLKNSFFKQNISPKELAYMSAGKDLELVMLAKQANELYKKLVGMKQVFETAQTQEEVNAIISEAADLKGEIADIDSKVGALWQDVYNHKMDNYIVLVDKLGGVSRDNLELIDQLGREVVQNEAVSNNSVAQNLAILPFQKNLIIGYETVLASELKLNRAKDSLVRAKANKFPAGKYEDVVFPYRSVVIYSDITIGNDYDYDDLAQVPMIKLPSKGLYYAVQVAYVTGQASSLSIFKGALPLQQEDVAGGKKRYLLGGFRTYQEAVAASKQCYKFGFKNPIIIAWLDAKSVSIQAAQAYQKANPVAAIAKEGYKVEVITEKSDVAARLKNIVEIHANGKVISRVQNGDQYVYTISTFHVPEEAQVFVQILKTEFPSTKIEFGRVAEQE